MRTTLISVLLGILSVTLGCSSTKPDGGGTGTSTGNSTGADGGANSAADGGPVDTTPAPGGW